MSFPPVRAVIFDVDGLLINSEDIYTEVYLSVLRNYGVTSFPWKIKSLQMSRGRPGTERILKYANLDMTVEEWNALVKPHTSLFTKCQPLPGVPELLHNLTTRVQPPLQVAIASSSNSELFKLKTGHLPEVSEPIPPERRVFGSDPEMEGKSKKPAPDLFLIALGRLNKLSNAAPIAPEECLVFEDSIAGVEAARKAGMRVVFVPHPGLQDVARGHEEDIMNGTLHTGLTLEPVEDAPAIETGMSRDGWAEMIPSMKAFSFERYGIRLM
ncbi:HAD-like protein [Pseudovirgaria hyperparasitica]|uniref:HAD-like protein n=1 Tax=Pseudovirgaria hyperparasitica TaxID=470096 RepID=A0A6A6WAN8_9PEZI|nr:HAD-like protein [Pseudovirgaria hyperparasitica]KAF2759020.1 HAD-like protein [Pseudovirgaria hyperparasitica]